MNFEAYKGDFDSKVMQWCGDEFKDLSTEK